VRENHLFFRTDRKPEFGRVVASTYVSRCKNSFQAGFLAPVMRSGICNQYEGTLLQ
jgi:hypothetical protein